MLTGNKKRREKPLRVQVSKAGKNCQLHFQGSQTSLGWLVGTEEITFHGQGDWPPSLPVLTPVHLQLPGSVGGQREPGLRGALHFPSCGGFGCNMGGQCPPIALQQHTPALLSWLSDRAERRRAAKAETPFASFAVDFSVLSSFRHSASVLPGCLCLGWGAGLV